MGQVGIGPTVFPMSRFYRPLQSPLCVLTHIGGTGWNRTSDTLSFNQVLYQLSYKGKSVTSWFYLPKRLKAHRNIHQLYRLRAA